jgi:predicted MFS family arabinose efflux permease
LVALLNQNPYPNDGFIIKPIDPEFAMFLTNARPQQAPQAKAFAPDIGPDGADASGTSPKPSPLTRAKIFLFALASGLAVANAYFAHPLLDVMADDLQLSRATAGLIVGATQLGYGLGLVLLVPLGDLIDRRKLIIAQSLLSVLALFCVGFSSSAAMLLGSMAAVGLLAVVTQALVAYAASLAHPSERGHVVGLVTGGIVLGILLARSVAGILTDLSGWRTVYIASAILTSALALLLWRTLPRQQSRRPDYPIRLSSNPS